MREVLVYESRRRLRGALVITGGLAAYAVFIIGIFPSVAASGIDFDEYVESFPPAVRNAFNLQSLGTIEGFLAAEFYQFIWILLLGTYGAVLFPLLLVNVLAVPAVLAGLFLIGESVSLLDLLAVHVLAIPYLMATAAIGLVLSVLVSRASLAEVGGPGVVFLTFVVASVLSSTDVEWLRHVSPTAFYDPTAVLVSGEYDLLGAAILLGATVVLLALARAVFVRRDV